MPTAPSSSKAKNKKQRDHPLDAFAALSAQDAGKISKKVAALPAFVPPREITSFRHETTSGAFDTYRLITSLASLRGQNEHADPGELARRLSESAALGLRKNRQKAFARNLERVLRSDVVATFGKADDVITDHPNIFRSARVLTDIRPVFTKDPDVAPSAAVIVEMLRIHHWSKDGSEGNFYVALDHADLLALQRVIDRAVAKTNTLRQFLESAGLDYYQHQEVPYAGSDSAEDADEGQA